MIVSSGQERLLVGVPVQHAIFNASASSAMRMVERAAAEVASTELPVFIVGENGTGKGTLAAMIHRLSRRCERDFVKVNCPGLLPGKAAIRNSGAWSLGLNNGQLAGTIFLDEVLDLHPALQPCLMDLLPEGDMQARPEETPRIIAASGKDDGRELSDSLFSRELYYRLRGVMLRIPPLRERREDIRLLADFLLSKFAASFGRSSVRLSRRAEEQFQRHSWPGNVRELENAVKTLLAVEDEDVVLEALSSSGFAKFSRSRRPDTDLKISLKEASRTASRKAEKQLISEVLERTRWNRKRAAHELNISYKALLYKLKQMGLDDRNGVQEEEA